MEKLIDTKGLAILSTNMNDNKTKLNNCINRLYQIINDIVKDIWIGEDSIVFYNKMLEIKPILISVVDKYSLYSEAFSYGEKKFNKTIGDIEDISYKTKKSISGDEYDEF